MIGLAIRFDLGRYHANPWGSHVNDAANEWPPSPWRLIRALYAVARSNVGLSRRRHAIDRALQTLVDAPAPIFDLPPVAAAHTRHYMPESTYSALRAGDTAKVIDGFLALDPVAELSVWWDVALDSEATDGLAATARCLGYLGRSESVCSARLVTGTGPEQVSAAPAELAIAEHQTQRLVDLLCPDRGQSLEAMAVSVTDLRQRRRLVPPGTRRVPYIVSAPEPVTSASPRQLETVRPTLALLRLQGSHRPAMTDAVAVGQAVRAALQRAYGDHNGRAASPTFSGRAGDMPRSDQHRHAHYLALPGDHGRRVDHLVVWAPEGFGAGETKALAELSRLSMYGIPEPMRTALAALGSPGDLRLPGLLGEATFWRSLTPFGLVRHPKARGGKLVDAPEDQVRLELAHRGFPEPEQVSIERGSWHRYRSSKVGTSRLARTSVFGVRVGFSEPVIGPVCLGAFSHFGLGLMVPER